MEPHELEIEVLPDGREEWRNIICPPNGVPGGVLEVRKDEKQAAIVIPAGVRVGDKFNVTITKPFVETGGVALEVVTLPDGTDEWRNILLPAGPPCTHLEVTKGDRSAIVRIPDGVKPGERFHARPSSDPLRWGGDKLEVVTLPDGSEEWRNILLPPVGVHCSHMEVVKGDRTAIVRVPAGVKPGERFNAPPANDDAVACMQRWGGDEIEVETLPDGREEWRNIVCPPGVEPGGHVEVRKGSKQAVVGVPKGVKVGEKFNAVLRNRGMTWDAEDLHVLRLPDGTEQWRNIVCPPGPYCRFLEVKQGQKKATVEMPPGLKPGEKFNANATTIPPTDGDDDVYVVTLPDGSEEWRNILLPPVGVHCSHMEVVKGDRTAIVRVPAGVKPGERFNAPPANDDAVACMQRWGGDEIEVETLPDGREEWRNIVCPPGVEPGGHVEVRKGSKQAVVGVPKGVKVGEKFNAVLRNRGMTWDAEDLHVLRLPDGTEQWRNIVCPPGPYCRFLEVKQGQKKATVEMPPGLKPGEKFNANATTIPPTDGDDDVYVVTLPDGSEEWRNILLPPVGVHCSHMEVVKGDRTVIVRVPAGVKPGERFNAPPANDDAVACMQRWGGDEIEVETLPDGREEWRNIVCPPGVEPGGHVEVRKGSKQAVVGVPKGVKVGEKFNAVLRNRGMTWDAEDLHVLRLPDGTEQWRNIVCPPGPYCRFLEVKQGQKKATVEMPPGLKPGEKFNANATTIPPTDGDDDMYVVTLPDGSEEWRNIVCPPGTSRSRKLDVKATGKSATVNVPDWVQAGDKFTAYVPATNVVAAGTESENKNKMRARLQRKLEQRKQAGAALDAAREEAESERQKREKKLAAKRAKRERQKQRKRAEAATAAGAESLADPMPEYEEPSDPVPKLEEAPELDFDYGPPELEEMIPPPRRDTTG